jgi:hypothetical protein
MADLSRDFWIRETGTGQQVAQLHDRYMMVMVMMMMMMMMMMMNNRGVGAELFHAGGRTEGQT